MDVLGSKVYNICVYDICVMVAENME